MSKLSEKFGLLAATVALQGCGESTESDVDFLRHTRGMPDMPRFDAAILHVLDGGEVSDAGARIEMMVPDVSTIPAPITTPNSVPHSETPVDAGVALTPHEPEDVVDAGSNLADAGGVDAGLECTRPYVPYQGECVEVEMDAGMTETEVTMEVDSGKVGESAVIITLNPSNSTYYPQSFVGSTETTVLSFNIEALGPSEVIFGTGNGIMVTFAGQQEGGAIDENMSCFLKARLADGETWVTYSTNAAVQSGTENFEFSDATPLSFQNTTYTFAVVCDTITGWTLTAGDRIQAQILANGDNNGVNTVTMKQKDIITGTVTDVALVIPVTFTGPTLTTNI